MIDQKYGLSVYGFENNTQKEITIGQMIKWCTHTFGKYRPISVRPKWKVSFSTFYFLNESHRNLFLLKWG